MFHRVHHRWKDWSFMANLEVKHTPITHFLTSTQLFIILSHIVRCLMYIVLCAWRWSGGGDDRYFAMLGKGTISLYETETFSLVGNTSLELENVVDFSWSPTDSILCIFVQDPGNRNQLARVSRKKSLRFTLFKIFIR